MKNKGFTLIELMIVVAIIAIIAAIAIPNLLRSRMSANEASAVGGIRTISTGEASFQAAGVVTDANGIGQYGSLNDLGTTTPPFIDAALSNGAKSGYSFVAAAVVGVAPAYTATANPSAVGSSGNRSYFVSEDGVIHVMTDGTVADVTSPVLN